jgi:heme exporter protein A
MVRFQNAPEPALAFHYVGHLNGLKSACTVRSHVRYWRGLLGGPDHDERALHVVGLAGVADVSVRALSQGQARRLALARLFVAPRPIWILDEPAAALDADGRALVAEAIASHRDEGGVVLAAVHAPLGPKPDLTITLGSA